MNAQVQYRRNDNDQTNVFPTLGGTQRRLEPRGAGLAQHRHKRTMHTVSSTSRGPRRRRSTIRVRRGRRRQRRHRRRLDRSVRLGRAGALVLQPVEPARRRRRRSAPTAALAGYTWTRPVTTAHAAARRRLPLRSTPAAAPTRTRAARSSSPACTRRAAHRPRAATASTSPISCSACRSRRRCSTARATSSCAAIAEPVRRRTTGARASTLTFNLGLRYELLWPFVEKDGQMVNLDVHPDFTAAVPVVSGQTGPFTGPFPSALINTDTNNIAPRVGVAWRFKPGTILRGGYGVSYNAGAYSTIARQLVGQPPFAVTSTASATAAAPLTCHRPARTAAAGRDDQQLRRRPRLRARRGADVERRPVARPPPGVERQRRLHPHARLQPRHRARPQPRPRRRCASTASSRSSGSRPKARRRCTPATFRLRRRPVKGIGVRRDLHARPLARQRLHDRRRRARSSRRTTRTSTPSGGFRASIGGTSSPPTRLELPFGPNRRG